MRLLPQFQTQYIFLIKLTEQNVKINTCNTYNLLTPNTRAKEEMSNVGVTIRPNNSSLYVYYPK
jgi:hypothetical protein